MGVQLALAAEARMMTTRVGHRAARVLLSMALQSLDTANAAGREPAIYFGGHLYLSIVIGYEPILNANGKEVMSSAATRAINECVLELIDAHLIVRRKKAANQSRAEYDLSPLRTPVESESQTPAERSLRLQQNGVSDSNRTESRTPALSEEPLEEPLKELHEEPLESRQATRATSKQRRFIRDLHIMITGHRSTPSDEIAWASLTKAEADEHIDAAWRDVECELSFDRFNVTPAMHEISDAGRAFLERRGVHLLLQHEPIEAFA